LEAVIGLEIHVQLRTRSKIFCACSAAYGAPPNTHVCPVCLGHPGVLPVLNRQAVAFGLRFGLAVEARIPERSLFARKNYFYPDLPKGYQISQLEAPLLVGGRIRFTVGGRPKSLLLTRAHLEEDAGKLLHPEPGRDAVTFVDLNRAGVPLLEVVSEPDLRSPLEARLCLERLHQIVVYLGICDGNMEEGSLRCDANVSVRARGQETLNPKTEIKNLNSFRHVERALAWEVKRQTAELEDGGTLVQATRLWDEAAARTRVMRTKEEAEDYRYFPEPDLPPLVLDPAWIEAERASLPELPQAKEERLVSSYGLSSDEAHLLAGTPDLADYFEGAARESGDARATINWVVSGILRLVKEDPAGVVAVRIRPEALGRLVRMVGDGTISGKIAKTVFEEMAKTGVDPESIVKQQGLRPVTDVSTLREVAESVLASHPGVVAEYLAGKEAALQFFMGQVMRETRGQADPEIARRTVREALESRRTP